MEKDKRAMEEAYGRITDLMKLPDGRYCLTGKLGLVLMGGAMFLAWSGSHSVVSDSLQPHGL